MGANLTEREPDLELMERIAQADETALLALIDRYGDLVFSFAMRVVQHKGLAEEISQDVFVKIWQKPSAYVAGKARFSSWLLTMTRYTAIDHLRREMRQSAPTFPLDEAVEMSDDVNQHDPLLSPLEAEMMRALLADLPPDQARAIEMAFFQGLSRDEMAAQLQVAVGTVKTRLRLGLKKLRVLWDEKMNEPIENQPR